MTRMMPSLWFADQVEDAARFYVAAIPGSRIDRVWTMRADSPAGPAGSVKVVEFTVAGTPVTAMQAGPMDGFTHALSLTVACDTQAELDAVWTALLDGGAPAECGWLRDRFGVHWQVVPRQLNDWMADPDPAAAARTAQAMMTMVKFDIAALQRVHAGA